MELRSNDICLSPPGNWVLVSAKGYMLGAGEILKSLGVITAKRDKNQYGNGDAAFYHHEPSTYSRRRIPPKESKTGHHAEPSGAIPDMTFS